MIRLSSRQQKQFKFLPILGRLASRTWTLLLRFAETSVFWLPAMVRCCVFVSQVSEVYHDRWSTACFQFPYGSENVLVCWKPSLLCPFLIFYQVLECINGRIGDLQSPTDVICQFGELAPCSGLESLRQLFAKEFWSLYPLYTAWCYGVRVFLLSKSMISHSDHLPTATLRPMIKR